METNGKLIGLVLMGMLLIFGTVCTVAWAEKPPAAAEPSYPASLSQVRTFHEEFAKPGSYFNFDSSLSDLTGVTFFDDSEDEEGFQGVVAINTEKRRTVTSEGQFQSLPTDINYMDIDVRNIIVISINTARGGNAIATSEIFIEPTQHGSCTS